MAFSSSVHPVLLKFQTRSVECTGLHSLWLVKGTAPLKANALSQEAHSRTVPAGTVLTLLLNLRLSETSRMLNSVALQLADRGRTGVGWSHSEKHVWGPSVPVQLTCVCAPSFLFYLRTSSWQVGAGNVDRMPWGLLSSMSHLVLTC